jgi:biopolymer transport protein ExbD
MAGTESEDNPLPVNVVPMVDVIFCLCVFFLASYQQRASETRLDTWLPKDRGEGPGFVTGPLAEWRVVLGWKPQTGEVTRRFGHRDLHDSDELARVVREARDAGRERNAPEQPLILDAEAGVPWAAAIEVVDLGRELGIERVEFAQGPR